MTKTELKVSSATYQELKKALEKAGKFKPTEHTKNNYIPEIDMGAFVVKRSFDLDPPENG